MQNPISQIPMVRSGPRRLVIVSTARDFPSLVALAAFLEGDWHVR